MKIKFDWPHIRWVIGCVLIAALGVYEHSALFGNAHPAPLTLSQGITYAGMFVIALYGLLARSPADAWKIAEGELLEVTQALGGGRPPAVPPPNSTPTMTMPPTPPTAARRALAWAWCLICTVVLACTPAKQATAITLGSTAECVFVKIDAGESPEQAATDCNVGVQDVFQLISLFDKRAAARRLCGPAPDGGSQ